MDAERTGEKKLSSPAVWAKRGLLPAVLMVAGFLSSYALGEPVQWSQNGHWYEVVSVTSGINWADANSAATAQGGYLATLTSADENSFVFELTQTAVPSVWYSAAEWTVGPWLGGTDAEVEGDWKWVTAEPWSYSSWLGGQPDNWNNEDHLSYWGPA
jgi:hypothetical protein